MPPHGLTLVAPQPRQRSPRTPLALWHLLSLDAPTVAALWTWFIAYCSGLHLPWTPVAAMFVAVWMLYAADRLLDARDLEEDARAAELEERHRFHHHHRRSFLIGIAIASIVLAFLLHHLDSAALRQQALLASLLFAYFFLIHIFPSTSLATETGAHRLPKELAVGIFFPAAVFVPTVARVPHLRALLAPNALLFAAVCTLNCLFLYAWEHPGERSSAHWTTRFATRHLASLTCITVLLSFLSALLEHQRSPHGIWLLACACGCSASLLLLLHTQRQRIAAIHLRAAADLVLLTPAVLVPLSRVFAR
jgi:cell division protein FtsW (lipid II flippase)